MGRTLSLGEWLRSLSGRKEFAYFSRGDRMPGLVNLSSVVRELAGRAVRKLWRILRGRRKPTRALPRDKA